MVDVKKRLFFFSVLLLLFFPLPEIHSLSIYLKKAVVYNHQHLTLEDMARVDDTVSDILLIPLAIPLNRIVLIPPHYVRKMMETKYDGPLIIVGQRSALIPASLIPRGSDWFFQELIAFIEQQDRDSEGYLEIELTAIPYTIPDSVTESVEFKLLSAQKRNGYLAGDTRLYYNFYTPENTITTGTINIKIHQVREVALARQDIVRNGTITKESIGPLACDLATFNQDLLLYEDYTCEYTARQPIHKGEFIFLSKIKQDYLVKGGDEVNIVFLNGNMKVVMPGKALEGGTINSLIRIRPYYSKMEFAARIIGPREVLVEID